VGTKYNSRYYCSLNFVLWGLTKQASTSSSSRRRYIPAGLKFFKGKKNVHEIQLFIKKEEKSEI
jgi:hypothetical protein